MNRNNLKCTLNCQNNEDQRHVLIHCEPVLKLIQNSSIVVYEDIFGSLEEQTQVIRAFIHIEKKQENISLKTISYLGEETARTLACLISYEMVQQIISS